MLRYCKGIERKYLLKVPGMATYIQTSVYCKNSFIRSRKHQYGKEEKFQQRKMKSALDETVVPIALLRLAVWRRINPESIQHYLTTKFFVKEVNT